MLPMARPARRVREHLPRQQRRPPQQLPQQRGQPRPGHPQLGRLGDRGGGADDRGGRLLAMQGQERRTKHRSGALSEGRPLSRAAGGDTANGKLWQIWSEIDQDPFYLSVFIPKSPPTDC